MTKKLYLFRHGETDWNNRTITAYSPEVNDIELNEKGLEQARKNAEFLKDSKIRASSIYMQVRSKEPIKLVRFWRI